MKKILFVVMLLSFGTTIAFSQTNTSTVLGNWNVDGNWSEGHVPYASEDVVIDYPITIQSATNAVAASVQVGDADASTLTIWGTLNISETAGNSLTVSHSPSDVFVNGTLTFTGNITIDAGTSLKVNGPDGIVLALESGEAFNPTTGETWMDRNLGASQVATASDDTDAYGDL